VPRTAPKPAVVGVAVVVVVVVLADADGIEVPNAARPLATRTMRNAARFITPLSWRGHRGSERRSVLPNPFCALSSESFDDLLARSMDSSLRADQSSLSVLRKPWPMTRQEQVRGVGRPWVADFSRLPERYPCVRRIGPRALTALSRGSVRARLHERHLFTLRDITTCQTRSMADRRLQNRPDAALAAARLLHVRLGRGGRSRL